MIGWSQCQMLWRWTGEKKKGAGLQGCWGDITQVTDAWEKSQSNLATD